VSIVATGDWVQARWPGIWQVYRIESGFFESRWDLSEPKKRSERTLVFIRGIIGKSGKRSFDTQMCEVSLVAPLTDEQRQWLDAVRREQPDLLQAFDAYEPKPVDLVTNIGFGLPDQLTFDDFAAACERLLEPLLSESPVTTDEVLTALAGTELDQYRGQMPQTATLQLTSPDHLRRDDEFVSTRFRTLNF
jgi:hypothetical protein